jgi:2-amino-4-hydroxy-6-hydroxymethyldihydropteridine diphosphokinase
LEKKEGRVRGRDKSGPRSLDADLIDWDDEARDHPKHPLPHPDIPVKAYVLFPFLEIAPRWIHPVTGLTLVELAARFKDKTQKIKRLDPNPLG